VTRAARPPDLEALTGLRSGKPHYFPEHRTSAERLRRVIAALERISSALVRTTEGSEALVRAVVEAAADHLSAQWVVFALADGELVESRPRHLVLGPDRVEWTDIRAVPHRVRQHLVDVVRGADDARHDAEAHRRHLHVPVRLDGRVVGGFVAWTPPDREVDETDRSVLHILAGQTAAALQNCALLEHSPGCWRTAPARRTTWPSGTTSCRPPKPSWAPPGNGRCSTPNGTGSPASCTTA
jgi:GAF domain